MIQCKDCQYFEIDAEGRRSFKCDPFTNIVEPQCLAKWQLIRLDMLVASYRQMLQWYQKLAPMQDKMLKFMRHELEDLDEADKWKISEDEDDDEDEPPEL